MLLSLSIVAAGAIGRRPLLRRLLLLLLAQVGASATALVACGGRCGLDVEQRQQLGASRVRVAVTFAE